MPVRSSLILFTGAVVTALLAMVWGARSGGALSEQLSAEAARVVAASGARDAQVRFATAEGWPSRHALLTPAANIDERTRADLAKAVAAIPGVGGVHWSDGTMLAQSGEARFTSMHCQDDVAALLDARTLRFEESSASMDFGNDELLDEVAAALRPCLGSIIAVIGHTDSSGDEIANLELSRDRADTVRRELIARGIPRGGLRASGVGANEPIEGLDPADPANRRIEFSVISKVPLIPTPVDTPSAR